MIEPNKITFTGDPVAHGFGSKIAAFFQRNDVVATGLAVTFAAAAAEIAIPGGNAAAQAVIRVLGDSIFFSFIQRRLEARRLAEIVSTPEMQSKCINKKPDKSLPPNLDKWGIPASRMKLYYGFLMVLLGTSEGISLSSSVKNALDPLIGLSGDAALFTRLISGYKRWDKVGKGDWRIEDRSPPPEPVRGVQPTQPAAMAARVQHALT